ncbi:hypothetical protein HK101_002740 [Irineochytrium annulatum]|nr:hypothetical protein HK101_002740 [Irineochytrium annulatum]
MRFSVACIVALFVGASAAPASFDILGQTIEVTLGKGHKGHGHGHHQKAATVTPSYPGKRVKGSVWEAIRENEQFSKWVFIVFYFVHNAILIVLDRVLQRFVEIVEREKGLKEEFENGNEMTIFVPTNDAIERLEDRQRSILGENDRGLDFYQVVQYHIVNSQEIDEDKFFDGMLLKTNLELEQLNGQPQRIRVSRFGSQITLVCYFCYLRRIPCILTLFYVVKQNMYSRVITSMQEQADNGAIWAIDSVLIPPLPMMDLLFSLPTKFSTSIAAIYRAGLENEINSWMGESGMTLFMPDNGAWKSLGMQNVYYLFSEGGKDDLKKILQYHICDELVYTTKLMREEKVEIGTKYNGVQLEIEARERRGARQSPLNRDRKDGHRGDRDRDGRRRDRDGRHGGHDDDDEDRDRDGRRRGGHRGDRDRDGGRRGDRGDRKRVTKEEDDQDEELMRPHDFVFVINDGEARVDFPDGLSENGVVHVISNVLIPEDVTLPDEDCME